MSGPLDSLPAWSIVSCFALAIVAAGEIGFVAGRSRFAGHGSERTSGVVYAAAFTLVGLLFGFSFSLGLSRYDARRAIVVGEANAIGTTFLRTELLDERTAALERAALEQYVAQRLAFESADERILQRQAADTRSSQLQQTMWKAAVAAARRDPRSTSIPLFVTSLNETIDIATEENAALGAHIPDSVVLGLVAITLIASAMMGFGFGRQNQRAWLSTALLALTLALALGLVLDLDRPQRGLTRVDLSAMRTTRQQLETTQH